MNSIGLCENQNDFIMLPGDYESTPPVMADEKRIVQWIRFLGGSSREELKAMSERMLIV